MEPIVDLAPGADASSLAQYFADRIQSGLETPDKRRTFLALKATVFVVDFDSGETVSFRFDHGRLTVHEGPIGVPSVTFGGPRAALFSLEAARLTDLPRALVGARSKPVTLVETDEGRPSSPPPSSPGGRPQTLNTLALARLYLEKELRVYGLLSHPRTVARFLKLVSNRS